MTLPTKSSPKTAAAICSLWGPQSPELRWEDKRNRVLLFIARLGWSTVELTNFYLCQTKRDWPAKMVSQGWIKFRTIIVDTHPASVLVLTQKAQTYVRQIDSLIGRRVDREIARQAQHDLVASWVATWFALKKLDLFVKYQGIKIWSDRLLRQRSPNDAGWPDIAIEHQDETLLYIEVERTRKTKPQDHYHFLKKLSRYQEKNIETVIVFEKASQANLFVDDLKRAENIGLNRWVENPYSKKFFEVKSDDREIFYLKLMIGVWDQTIRNFTEMIFHNYVE